MVKHLALSITQGNITLRAAVVQSFSDYAINASIPILSFYVLQLDKGHDLDVIESLTSLLSGLDQNFFHIHQVKISFIGQWYSLPDSLVELMKQLMESTKDYDQFFLNFCVNYDGKEELVAACKLIALQIQSGKLSAEHVDETVVKENTYNSYFLPPDVMVFTEGQKTNSFLLWDSFQARMLFIPLEECTVSRFLNYTEPSQKST